MIQLLLTIDFVHKMGLLHRDLKPDNILVSTDQDGLLKIKISDLGVTCPSVYLNKHEERELCGSLCYVAPEVLSHKKYTEKSDVFTLGSVLYNLMTHKPLFEEREIVKLTDANKKCDL